MRGHGTTMNDIMLSGLLILWFDVTTVKSTTSIYFCVFYVFVIIRVSFCKLASRRTVFFAVASSYERRTDAQASFTG